MTIERPFIGELDETEYRAMQREGAIGGSALSMIYRQSAAHYVEARTRKPSAAMELGTAVHTLILEPHTWSSRYFTGRAVQRRTFEEPIKTDAGWCLGDGSEPYRTKKAALEAMGADRPWTVAGSTQTYRTKKDAEAAVEELAEGRRVVSESEELLLFNIVNDIWSHGLAGELLAETDRSDIGTFAAEHALLWYDDEHGVDCSGKLDGLLTVDGFDWEKHGLELEAGSVIGIDLKTTGKPIAPEGYARRCIESGWHMQAAHYIAGAAAAGVQIDRWINVVVETGRPHGVRVVELSPMMLELGKVHRAQALKSWREWLDRKPGAPVYDPQPLLVDPPSPEVERDWSAWIAGVEASDRASKAE
jgi:hypothetical protein